MKNLKCPGKAKCPHRAKWTERNKHGEPIPDQTFLLSILTYNPETGHLTWKEGNQEAGKRAGCIVKGNGSGCGYRRLKIKLLTIKEHRVIWCMMTGRYADEIDHINRDRTDNRWENLREVDHSLNMQNREMKFGKNKNGFPGVTCRDGRFKAIFVFRKKQHCGRSRKTAEEAHQDYLLIREKILGSLPLPAVERDAAPV